MYSKQLHFFVLTICIIISGTISAQNTVGTLLNTPESFNGYTLFTAQTETYLINNCGEVINKWSSNFPPGNAVYLLEDGSLLRACKLNNPSIAFGGTGGRIEKYDWEGNLIWSYNYSNDTMIQHHDIYPMPNGNILVLAVTVMSNSEAIEAGRNPSMLDQGTLYNEQIIEIQPVGVDSATIVWEWNINDHFIQELDNTKLNFGVVADNPQLLDINFLNGLSGNSNWLHVNSIQYNAQLDQIVLSSRHLSEIYIIDHSTTTAEAASHSGGLYNKGGDFLYRWGNPQAYQQGTIADQILFGQHYPHWIPEGHNGEGKLIVYNNGFGRTPSYSEVLVISPPTDAPGVYTYESNNAYGPLTADYIYTDPVEQTNFFSRILSSAQKLPNGNTLICDGDSGFFFEIDTNHNIVWEYYNPAHSLGIMSQGENPDDFANVVFRAIRYAPDYSAFVGRELTPGNPIELNPDLSECNLLNVDEFALNTLTIYPNPATHEIRIKNNLILDAVSVYNTLGALVAYSTNSNRIDISTLQTGVYFLKIEQGANSITKKVIKQ